MKKRTQAQLKADCFQAYQKIKAGEPVKRTGRKDGSIAVKPFLTVYDIPEREVLKGCLAWLKKNRIFCTRHDCGGFDSGAGYATYGIKGAGDIVGLLRNGRHLEVECKAGKGGRLSLKQQERQKRITDNSGVYIVVCSVEELEYYLSEVI